VEVAGLCQVKLRYCKPVPANCKEYPAGVVLVSETLMSTDVLPLAGPFVAVKKPS